MKKKSNSVCYHVVLCAAVAMGEGLMGHVSTHDILVDICTKIIIPGGQKHDRHLVGLPIIVNDPFIEVCRLFWVALHANMYDI